MDEGGGGALPGLVVPAGDKGWMREGGPYLGWLLQQGTRDG